MGSSEAVKVQTVRSGFLTPVEKPAFSEQEISLWGADEREESHSLHYAVPYAESFRAELAAHFIENYSKRGEVVLDPFVGAGTTALEAALRGRIAFGSDTNPLAVRMAEAKLFPADLTEVTLALQLLNLRRPFDLRIHTELLAPFFHLDTAREIVNLREQLREQKAGTRSAARVASFIELVALSILHGHSAGFFSGYTFPQVSLTPEEQIKLNDKRGQEPDYRAVLPRLLRRTASVLRDGCTSAMRQAAVHEPSRRHKIWRSDARRLTEVRSGTVSLVLGGPPLPGAQPRLSEQWLRYWFSGIAVKDPAEVQTQCPTISSWRDFMVEVLAELARVVVRGGRVVLDLKEMRVDNETVKLDEVIVEAVREKLRFAWEPDTLLVNHAPVAHVGRTRPVRQPAANNRLLVLRRR